MIPLLELRGGLLAASLLKISAAKAIPLCIVGNIIPIPFILLFIRQIFKVLKKTKLFRGLVMKLEDFNYDLPKELIAQTPAEPRDSCRLMMLDRKTGACRHGVFHDLLNEIHEGDVFVFNNTRVIPARLYGQRETGGRIEVLF